MTFPTLIVEIGFNGGASSGTYLHLDDVARGRLDTATLAPEALFWTDVTEYVHKGSIRRGANRVESPILRYEAGTLSLQLDNSDRRFDPTNLSGPYVSAGVTQVTPMRAVRVLAEHDGVVYNLFRGFADRWAISYDGPNYSVCELTATDGTKVLADHNRGAVGAIGASELAGARVNRILDSVDWPDADRIVAPGDTTLQATTLDGEAWTELLVVQDTEIGEIYLDAAGRVVFRNRQASFEDSRSRNAQALFGDDPVTGIATTVNLVTNPSAEVALTNWSAGGFSNQPTLTRSSTQAMFGTWSMRAAWATATPADVVQVTHTVSGLTEGFTYTASVYAFVPAGDPPAVIFAAGGFGDSTGALFDQWVRIAVTFTATGITENIQIWPDLATTTAGDLLYLDGMQVEFGAMATTYVDGTQSDSEWDGVADESTSRRLPELPYAEGGVTVDYDDTTIRNLVTVSCVGGSEQTAEDLSSQEQFLVHTHNRTDLIMESDAVASDYASFILFQGKDPELRFSELEIAPRRDETELFPQVLGREFGDKIRIVRRPPGGGTIERDVFIRGVSHDFTPLDWHTRWSLQSATKYSFFILDDNALGVLDQNALAH